MDQEQELRTTEEGYAVCPRCTRKELPEELKPPTGIEYVRAVCRICREELEGRDRRPMLAVWDGITYAHARDAARALKDAEDYARRSARPDMAQALRRALIIAEDVMLSAGVYSGELASPSSVSHER